MGIVTPLRDDDGHVIAALLVHDFKSRETASRILSMVRLGQSGETYVFNRDGLMLSESRFDGQLRELGLIPDEPNATSARMIHLRDPGGDLTSGFVPEEPREAQPLTKMARLCTSGHDGDDLDGYRDYRGVSVVGAWRWLEDLEVGVASELDVDEAEPGLQILYWESWAILGLFAACMGITLFSYYSVNRMRQRVGELRKLGQYTLEKQIGYSLREAHGSGLVHRDLKPGNIMVCQRGGEYDVAKVLDFGLVKKMKTSESQQITSTNLVAGTPRYIAPERLSNVQANDPRSDIYSLGAVGFFILTGRDCVQGGSLAEILLQVVSTPPKRPSECTGVDIPKELDELIYSCLAKDPEDRPGSVEEILAVLENMELAREWTRSQAESWWREKEIAPNTANAIDNTQA